MAEQGDNIYTPINREVPCVLYGIRILHRVYENFDAKFVIDNTWFTYSFILPYNFTTCT